MKILFVANRVPFPPYRGDKLKIYNLALRLSKNNELYLITFAETKKELKYKQELEGIFKKVTIIYLPKWKSYLNCFFAVFSSKSLQVAYFKSPKMKQIIFEFVSSQQIDVIHTQHLRMAQFTKDLKFPKILDLPDAFSLYWKRRIENSKNALLKFFEKREYIRLYTYEKNILKHFELALVCSKEDLNYIQNEHQATNVKLLKNGVDLTTFHSLKHKYEIDDIVLFTGNMNYTPNVDAVIYFVQNILPIIKEQNKKVKFIIAGQKPVNKVRQLANNYIEITGFVKNLGDYYQKASVVVSPLRYGAGTQNKVLEAMAMGIPVVCSNIGFEGLEIENGEGAFMESNPEKFAKKTLELLESENLRQKTGLLGMENAKNKYSWDIIALQLESYCQELVK